MTDDSLYVDASALPWRQTPCSGVEWKKLYFDPATGESAVLLRFAAGASYGTHRHPGGEEYVVLEGSVVDGEKTYGPGTYVRHPPGSIHRPVSPQGSLLFVRLARPIEIVDTGN